MLWLSTALPVLFQGSLSLPPCPPLPYPSLKKSRENPKCNCYISSEPQDACKVCQRRCATSLKSPSGHDSTGPRPRLFLFAPILAGALASLPHTSFCLAEKIYIMKADTVIVGTVKAELPEGRGLAGPAEPELEEEELELRGRRHALGGRGREGGLLAHSRLEAWAGLGLGGQQGGLWEARVALLAPSLVQYLAVDQPVIAGLSPDSEPRGSGACIEETVQGDWVPPVILVEAADRWQDWALPRIALAPETWASDPHHQAQSPPRERP
ncbi:LOW QUALITY PROTEIN: Tumor necrosis factor receptor superfamily member 8 [Plecturocebus cupreus]